VELYGDSPSVDVLFRSVAETFGSRSTGIILTGMGSDGVKGLREMKEKGGFTIAQDEETSAIFGMPRVSIESNVVDKVLPLTAIAEEILKRA
jgi:two-component system chemotaxis response regulator CheB